MLLLRPVDCNARQFKQNSSRQCLDFRGLRLAPLVTGKAKAASLAATGSDRAAIPSVFLALRGAAETPSRIEALRMYASGSAWFAHDEAQRGTLAAGKFADLAVLSKDNLGVPVAEIGGIHSLLTMVGGRVVYADGPFAKYEARR